MGESSLNKTHATFFKHVCGLNGANSQKFRNLTEAYWDLLPHPPGKETCTRFYMCTHNGHMNVLRLLVKDFDPDQLRSELDMIDLAGDTALHYAVDHGHTRVIEALLEAGADASLRNNVGLAALHKAVTSNRRDVVIALIQGGANIDIRTAGKKPDRTPLHLAAEDGLLDIVEQLVEHGSNTEILALTSSQSSKAVDIAFQKGHGDIFGFLLAKDVDSGRTTLDRTVIYGDANLWNN